MIFLDNVLRIWSLTFRNRRRRAQDVADTTVSLRAVSRIRFVRRRSLRFIGCSSCRGWSMPRVVCPLKLDFWVPISRLVFGRVEWIARCNPSHSECGRVIESKLTEATRADVETGHHVISFAAFGIELESANWAKDQTFVHWDPRKRPNV